MDQQKMTKQMVDLYKSSFDNTFQTITMLQDQGEWVVNMFFKQAPWLPEQFKEVIFQWIEFYKNGIDGFKKAADGGFKTAENLFVIPSFTKGK
jgi:hypothetical protein